MIPHPTPWHDADRIRGLAAGPLMPMPRPANRWPRRLALALVAALMLAMVLA